MPVSPPFLYSIITRPLPVVNMRLCYSPISVVYRQKPPPFHVKRTTKKPAAQARLTKREADYREGGIRARAIERGSSLPSQLVVIVNTQLCPLPPPCYTTMYGHYRRTPRQRVASNHSDRSPSEHLDSAASCPRETGPHPISRNPVRQAIPAGRQGYSAPALALAPRQEQARIIVHTFHGMLYWWRVSSPSVLGALERRGWGMATSPSTASVAVPKSRQAK